MSLQSLLVQIRLHMDWLSACGSAEKAASLHRLRSREVLRLQWGIQSCWKLGTPSVHEKG